MDENLNFYKEHCLGFIYAMQNMWNLSYVKFENFLIKHNR